MPEVGSVEDYRMRCATCGERFVSRNALHRHLRRMGHRWKGDPPRATDDARGYVTESAPGTDEAAGQQLQDQDAQGLTAGMPKPVYGLEYPGPNAGDIRNHPGPKMESAEIKSRDHKWVDIGSGMVSRIFTDADRVVTATKSGPPMCDIKTRRIWSLTTGRLLDEADVENVPDKVLHLRLKTRDNIRVELVLKDAIALFERKGPDVAEIFSQPRVCQEAGCREYQGATLRPGWSLDLTTVDPRTGERWDLSRPEVQKRVRNLVRETQPYFVIGSPPCTAFSPLQEISRAKRDPKVMEQQLRKAKAHIRFCVEIYKMQLAGRRHFIHEHPEKSKAWNMPEMVEMMARPEVGAVVCHMCGFGMMSEDKDGRGLVRKATRIMTSSGEVLKRLNVRCSNEGGASRHRHVHLEQGRARQAQVYPRRFCTRVCEAIAAQKRLEMLGVDARPIMSIEEMNSIAKNKT